jgi:putative PIN family toxin of toxin-antitoxin system
MKRSVLDTNILVSAMLTPGGTPAKVLELALDGGFIVVCCDEIFAEYKDVLFRPHFGFALERVHLILDVIRESCVYVTPEKSGIPMIDESDRVFYDTAKSGNAVLATGNAKHYPAEPMVMTAAAFLHRLQHWKSGGR